MLSDIRFSILIPTYNRANLIIETLDTVFNQTYRNYEIIVVDNCSTDHTERLLSPLAKERKLIYIRHDRNYERSRSRNTGLQHATGDYVTFLDSDDFLYPECLADAASFARKHPDIKIFQNKYELVNNDQKPIYQFKFPSLKNQYKALASGNFISCIGGFVHKEVYRHIRFNEEPRMIGAEDYEIWFEVLSKHKMGRIEKINAAIREHPTRSVNTGVYDNVEYQRQYLIEKIKNNNHLFDSFAPYLSRLSASFYMQQAVAASQMRNKKKSAGLLYKALKEDFTILLTHRFYGILYNILK